MYQLFCDLYRARFPPPHLSSFSVLWRPSFLVSSLLLIRYNFTPHPQLFAVLLPYRSAFVIEASKTILRSRRLILRFVRIGSYVLKAFQVKCMQKMIASTHPWIAPAYPQGRRMRELIRRCYWQVLLHSCVALEELAHLYTFYI